jgi:flagellar motor switch protein FliN/FliY
MTTAPLFWLKKVETALTELQQIPLWGSPPPFPWEACSKEIGSLLQIPELKLEHTKTEFLNPEEITLGLGASPYDLSIALTPLKQQIHWLMPQADVAKLTQVLLSPREGIKGFTSPKYQEGFYRYLTLNILQILDELHPLKDLSLKLASPQQLPSTGALCVDVAMRLPNETLWGRLVCPPAFLQAFTAHFNTARPSLLSSPLTKEIDVVLRLELGNTVLSLSEWNKAKVGDLIVLDRGTYDPSTQKGTVTVVLEQTPLFRARLKDNHLKIVDYAYYYEEENTMGKHSDDDEKDYEEYEDEDEDLDEDDEDLDDEDEDEEDDDEEDDDDEDEEDEDEEDEEDDDEDEEDEEDEAEEEDKHEAASEEESTESDESHLWTAGEKAIGVSEEMISSQELPLTIAVEVTRLKMNLDKLLQMSIGNLIELPVRPEQGVHLVVNGKRIAQGELVKMGDVLGVKILQMG